MAAGDFTATDTPRLLLAVENAWADARANNRSVLYDPSTETVRALVQNDVTAFKRPLLLRDNCVGVEIGWLESNVTAQIVSNFNTHTAIPCSITGPMAESKKAIYKITHYAKVNFKIKEEMCANLHDFASIYAQLSLQGERALGKQIAQHALTRIHGFAGVNKYTPTEDNIGVAVAGDATLTKIARKNMTWQDAIPYFKDVQRKNRMLDPFVLDGSIFAKQRWLAAIASGKTNDVGAEEAYLQQRFYQDVENFEDAGMTDRLFQISRGAVAIAFKNVVESPEDLLSGKIRYTEPMGGLNIGQTVIKDVYVQRTEEAHPTQAGDCEMYRAFEQRVIFDMFVNPSLTGDTTTGVVEYQVDKNLEPKEVY